MKFLTAFAISIFSMSVCFADLQPFLVKVNSSGYTPPEWSRVETCRIYREGVTIQVVYGRDENRLVATRSVSAIFSQKVDEWLEQASREELTESDNFMCDGPSTSIRAQLPPADSTETFELFSTGGCGSPRKIRQGPASTALREIADTFCPTTYNLPARP